MCPVCITTVTLYVSGTTSIAGVTAFTVKRLRAKGDARELEPTIQSNQSKGEQDGYPNADQVRSFESGVPS